MSELLTALPIQKLGLNTFFNPIHPTLGLYIKGHEKDTIAVFRYGKLKQVATDRVEEGGTEGESYRQRACHEWVWPWLTQLDGPKAQEHASWAHIR